MKKLITLALCALPSLTFANTPIIIKEQSVSALPASLYDGWWVVHDPQFQISYALRYHLKDGDIHGEHLTFNCPSGGTSTKMITTSFKLAPIEQGFDLQYEQYDFKSHIQFKFIKPKTALYSTQYLDPDNEYSKHLPNSINWLYRYSETPTPYCPKS